MSATLSVVRDDALAQKNPLVSVCVLAYNQEEYIATALDSVLEQEVAFDYELIVGDDGSTDATRKILREYQQAYPSRIRLNLHEEHDDGIPGRQNMVTNLRSARGKYVALLDGDDYWISDDKLQRQTEFLESHPDVAFSFHNALHDFRDRGDGPAGRYLVSEKYRAMQESGFFTHADMVWWRHSSRLEVPAASVMFRKEIFDPVPDWFWRVWNADWVQQVYFSTHGRAHYHRDLISYYRRGIPTSMRAMYGDSLARTRWQIEQTRVLDQISPIYHQRRDMDLYAHYRQRTRMLLERGLIARATRCLLLGTWSGLRAPQVQLRKRIWKKLLALF
jgi:glycosyltransferase involved in cell wall biosynthesis